MKLFARENPKPVPERRSSPRTRVDCMVTLNMPSGNVPGRFFDISESGARITAENPPSKGCAVILEWPYGEAYGFISWSKPGMCGLQFERAIPVKMLEETIENAPAGPRLVHSAEGSDAVTGGGLKNGAPPRLFC
ncbi:PilZ domain-containing protein [Aurantiacibacter sp. D1-12]|uniref:PilZ domain-containing protein n=1 Tax=Aurantiacibacter sp. D1-12 TaxID=2993658 RepID=UPI00237CC56E|nr:PilZ domain-containing protein [Aurantiacibacter sp. D1-12]MDE1466851.1 PilZ domain-containing protein [Aurantiacibacter sp. D1-12]